MSVAPWVIVAGGFHFQAGQSKAVASLAGHLARAGVPAHLVGNEFDPRFFRYSNLVIHRTPLPRGVQMIGNVFTARTGRTVAQRVVESHPNARVVVNGGNCQWPDVNWVHYLHHAWNPCLAGAPAWFRLKESVARKWYLRQERAALRATMLVIANSERTKADLIERLGVAAERVRVVYYGADPTWTPPTEDERRRARERFDVVDRPAAVFVGGFGHDNRKGFDTLLAAWDELCRDPRWDVDLLMAGSGAAAGRVDAWVKERGWTSRIRLLGHTANVYELLAAADVLVSPVRYEAYGLNVQEALCRGVPAIVSAIAGVTEHIRPELQPLVVPDPSDATELVARLRTWRDDVEGWRMRCLPTSESLRRRTWDDMAREFVAAVESHR